MKLFINNAYLRQDISLDEVDQTPIPSSARIADIWARARVDFGDGPKVKALLGRLGVAETDKKAQDASLWMMKKIFSGEIEIKPSKHADESGVYFLFEKGAGKPFAVFKVGAKRANMELAARQMFHELGMESHIVSGMFVSMTDFKDPREPIIEELFNGNQKVLFDGDAPKGKGDKRTLTGILEPFITPEKDTEGDLLDFAEMTLGAMQVNLRDGKTSSILYGRQPGEDAPHYTIIDGEEIMGWRFNPKKSPFKDKVAATHLPYLSECKLAKAPLSPEQIEALSRKVNSGEWKKIYGYLEKLQEREILFADLTAEKLISPENFIAGILKLQEIVRDNMGLDKNLQDCNDKEFTKAIELARLECLQPEADVQLEKALDAIVDLRAQLSKTPEEFQTVIGKAKLAEDDPFEGSNQEYEDLEERIKPYTSGTDDGGCFAKIEKTKQILNDMKKEQRLIGNPHGIDVSKMRLFSRSQIGACGERMHRLQGVLTSADAIAKHCLQHKEAAPAFTVEDIVYNTDLLYRAHAKAMGHNHRHRSDIGRFTPEEMQVKLSSDDEDYIRRSPTYPTSFTDMPRSMSSDESLMGYLRRKNPTGDSFENKVE